MFLLDDGTVVYSASDLAAAAECEFAVLRALDAKLGRVEAPPTPVDAMLERAARLGDRHEERTLEALLEQHGRWDPATGRGVVSIERPERGLHDDRATLVAKHAETMDALRQGADVVFQAGFFDGRFGGWADFLVRDRSADGVVYAVYDTKLARHAKVTALLQLAAYADQLLAEGIATSPQVHLILGDGTRTDHRLTDLLPVYRERRRRLQTLLDQRAGATAAVPWGEATVRACGRCPTCVPEVEARRDVILVAGVRSTQRARLHVAGIRTMDDLAASTGPVEGIGEAALTRLRAQARLQVQQEPPGSPAHHDDARVVFELFAPEVVGALPPPDEGDLFFDFEGDPLWAENGSPDWGLEYLFGVVENPPAGSDEPPFRAFWAHDRAQEKQALLDFLTYLTARRRQHPGLHVYHYAPYEKTALLRLAARHGVGEDTVDELLRDGVLVDLYATVRASLRTGQRSYSIKKLEPLYMAQARAGEVTTAGDSIVEYADACVLRDSGDLVGWQERLDAIGRYNAYDCLSTLRLRDWLLARAAEQGVEPCAPEGPVAVERAVPVEGAVTPEGAVKPESAVPVEGVSAEIALLPDPDAPEHDTLVETLLTFADAKPPAHIPGDTPGHDAAGGSTTGSTVDRVPVDTAMGSSAVGGSATGSGAGRTPDQQAVALLAASLGYHWREEKPFWWAHFDRLVSEPQEWTERRSTFLVEEAEVLAPWHVPAGRRTSRRRLRLVGRLEPGSEIKAGASVYALYDEPLPDCARTSEGGRRGWTEGVEVVDVQAEGIGAAARDVLVVEDPLRAADAEHDLLPMALGPGRPPTTTGIAAAIRTLAASVAASLPDLPHQPAVDLLRRLPPRTRSGSPLPVAGDGPDDTATAIVDALLDLDGSYLAVQGPPGTGKTHTGARVIAALVEKGWRVGVVAQSHAVVENMLTGVADAGVPAQAIGKKPNGTASAAAPWTWLTPDAEFRRFHARQSGGYVMGGTVWDFTNAKRLPADRPFDLLVIDEAGQFALANTVAVSGAARNLLLLGDPQQLPQVSQGRHPEPVDRSALGWLTDGHDTLPAELGYFLARTWRMHPALCAVVSDLSYEGRLTSMPCTAERSLDAVAPGVRSVLVDHAGNAVSSLEEAAEVVRQVRAVVGQRWQDPAAQVDRPLEPSDVVVVAAYNAQVWTIRRALDSARLGDVQVGTVDLFQGRQAPVVIMSTAASSPDDVPRGMEFLLNRNRVNVAISRGQWCAVVVRSRGLTDYLPTRPERLEELGAFIGLASP